MSEEFEKWWKQEISNLAHYQMTNKERAKTAWNASREALKKEVVRCDCWRCSGLESDPYEEKDFGCHFEIDIKPIGNKSPEVTECDIDIMTEPICDYARELLAKGKTQKDCHYWR